VKFKGEQWCQEDVVPSSPLKGLLERIVFIFHFSNPTLLGIGTPINPTLATSVTGGSGKKFEDSY